MLQARLARLQRSHAHLVRLCLTCGGGGGRNVDHGGVVCDSLDCGLYFERRKAAHEAAALATLADAGLMAFEAG